jgi:hypothetical protein
MEKDCGWVDDETHRAALEYLERKGLGMPSAARTGVRAGEILVGVCECNWGLTIRVARDLSPCYSATFFCRHCLEDAFNLHNFVVFRPEMQDVESAPPERRKPV